MCQNWFSVIGQILDVVGFLFIAYEWHIMFKRDIEHRTLRVQADYERCEAEAAGKQWADPSAADYTMWRPFQKLINEDKKRRQTLFYPGVALVVLGFLGQLLGNWPHLFRSC
jgi:hypothetical protein